MTIICDYCIMYGYPRFLSIGEDSFVLVMVAGTLDGIRKNLPNLGDCYDKAANCQIPLRLQSSIRDPFGQDAATVLLIYATRAIDIKMLDRLRKLAGRPSPSAPSLTEDAVSVEGLLERYQAATTKRNTAPKTTFAALQGQQFRTPRKPRDWAVTWLALGILLIGGIIGSALGHIALYFLIMGVFK